MAKKKASAKQAKAVATKQEKKANSSAAKKLLQLKPAQKAKKKVKRTSFFKEVRQEMARVSWPKKEDVLQSTLVVLAVVIFFSVFVGITDIIFINLVKFLTLRF